MILRVCPIFDRLMPSVDVSSAQSHFNEFHRLDSAFRDVAVTKHYETPIQNSMSRKAVPYAACSKNPFTENEVVTPLY
jgi:hypothetical protein